MPGLLKTRIHVAKRMREIAAGLTDPADVEATVAYAMELERLVEEELSSFMIGDVRDQGGDQHHAASPVANWPAAEPRVDLDGSPASL